MSLLNLDNCQTAKYEDIRSQIKSGHVLALHHEFVASWYGLQIAAVQAFTGPIAHVGLLHVADGRVWLLESVVPCVRYSPLTNVAGEGFYWFSINTPMSVAESEFAFSKVGVGDPQYGTYSKVLGVRLALMAKYKAAMGQDISVSEDEKRSEKMECAKFVDLCREHSGVNMGHSYIPTDSVEALIMRYNVQPIHVVM